MKRVLVLLLVCLSSAVMFAQTNTHYTIVNQGVGSMYTKITGVIVIDGVEQTNTYLEMGAFDQDGICRGAAKGQIFPRTGRCVYTLQLRGNAGFTYTFKVWDGENNVELDLISEVVDDNGDPIAYLGNVFYQHNGSNTNANNPIDFVFTTPSTTPTEITWNEPTDWPSGTVPPAGDNVIIPDNSVVTIPDGCVANAGDITLGTGSSIVIEEGGQLFHNTEIPVTLELNIQGYTKANPAGYRLIAPPTYTDVANKSITATDVTNLVPNPTDPMDLYYFDGSKPTEEWRNYKANEFTELFLKKGYLYANSGGADLVFSGYTEPTIGMDIDLAYTDDVFGGWNLIGNPYTCQAAVSSAYYVLDGTVLVSKNAGNLVNPMQGFFVKATASGQNVTLTPSTTTKSGASLNITLSQANTRVDNAIINFNKGASLEKFQLDPNHAKVYMPVEGKDYAVACAENEGEMPVNFKTSVSGNYTISFNGENTEFRYLHLIDKKSGNDVDLIANPSYSFDAQYTDQSNRFKLVYATGNNASDNFAFISNGNLMILGIEGEATLQVIDVTGRVLSTETFSGSYSKSIDAAQGVYVLRLTNGINTSIQKIVVK